VGGAVASGRRAARRGPNWLSVGFLALAVVLAGVAVYLFLRGDDAQEVPPPPPAEAGENELIHVQQALQAQDLEVGLGRGTVPSETLTPPGQILTLDGATLYVFLYPDPTDAAEEAEAAQADPAAVLPARSRTGTPIATETPRVFAHSNVVAALVGGSDDLAGRVEQAIAGLA
jgi:hypothetical protein